MEAQSSLAREVAQAILEGASHSFAIVRIARLHRTSCEQVEHECEVALNQRALRLAIAAAQSANRAS